MQILEQYPSLQSLKSSKSSFMRGLSTKESKKPIMKMEHLQRDNRALKWRDTWLEGGACQDHCKQLNEESQSE